MSGEHLVLTIELQLCLVLASALNDLKNARSATVAEDDGMKPVARPRLELRPPAPMPFGLREASSRIRERA